MWRWRLSELRKLRNFKFPRQSRHLHTTPALQDTSSETANIRTIGILAHIDAGKTTTTERMLYYAGFIRSMGEVHHGNTVTDYMDQERERGITITAAAVSFDWNDHQFNLIDTPGHIDFTMEVEQSLGVLDGAVLVLDASAGVEAQTVTVWQQCDNHNLPVIIYCNKMDRKDASLKLCLESIEEKLQTQPLCLHLPIKDSNNKLKGVSDIINLEAIEWSGEGRGRKYTRTKLTESNNGKLWEESLKMKENIVNTLSDSDDQFANIVIQSESVEKIDAREISKSVRNATIRKVGVPVLSGSSYKNVGVQILMDSVIDFLPSPLDCNQLYKTFGDQLCAKVFKVQHDDQRGVLSFMRIFTGKLNKHQKIYNISKEQSEQGLALYLPYADEYESTNFVSEGCVGVVSGLKSTYPGNLVTSSSAAAKNAMKNIEEKLRTEDGMKELSIPRYLWERAASKVEDGDYKDIASCILGFGTTIPEPVFLCSIEPPSASHQVALETALSELQREDSSFRVINNEETGQTVLAGMGELHLDIIRERIVSEYKIDAQLGPLQIAYKETIKEKIEMSHEIDSKVSSMKQNVKITMSADPIRDKKDKTLFKLAKTHESASNLAHITTRQLNAIKKGVTAAMYNGPKLGCPMVDIGVTLHWLEIGRGTSDTFLTAAVTQCLRKIFQAADPILLEPLMLVTIASPKCYIPRIMSDLSRRRAIISDVNIMSNTKSLTCLVPLAELLGYSSDLRSLTSGEGSFTMEFDSNAEMTPFVEEEAIARIRGF